MKIVAERPPAWIMDGCLNQFRINIEHTYWTYGDTIYNPGGHSLPDHIIAHEEEHARQQEKYEIYEAHQPLEGPLQSILSDSGKDGWWRRYLADADFRKKQEADAYGSQYRFYCEKVKDRNRRALFLMQLARSLSGPLYQVAVTTKEALKMIEEKARP